MGRYLSINGAVADFGVEYSFVPLNLVVCRISGLYQPDTGQPG